MRQRRYRSWWRTIVLWVEDTAHAALFHALRPWRMAQHWWWETWHRGVRAGRRASAFRWLSALPRLLLWPVNEIGRRTRWVANLFATWWASASFRHLLQGLPALIVMVLVGIGLVGRTSAARTEAPKSGEIGFISWIVPLLSVGASKNTEEYDQAAIYAFERKNFDAADVYFRALLQVDPTNEKYRFGLARTAEARGNFEQALALMQELAPRDAKGYAPAHYWQAVRLLNSQDPKSLEAAEAHLLRCLQSATATALDAHALLGQIYMMTARQKQAEEHLKIAAPEKPDLWILLARVHVLLDKRSEARRDAERAKEYFSRIESKDLDNVQARLFCAEAHLFLEEFKDAALVLERGLKVSVTDPNVAPRYRAALGRVFFMWSEALRRHPQSQPMEQHALLKVSFQYDPTSQLLLRRLVLGLNNEGADAKLVRGVLEELYAIGQSMAVVEFLRAVDADNRGQMSAADKCVQSGLRADASLPVVVANLARTLVEFPPANPKLALDLVNLGLRSAPSNADLLHCRGYLRVRSGQWLEARMDLEKAEAQKPQDATIPRLLAEVYMQLGLREKAQQYMRRSQEVPRAPQAPQEPRQLTN